MCVSSELSVSLADTSCPPHHPRPGSAPPCPQLRAGGGSVSHTVLQNPPKGPGVSKQSAATASAAAFSLQFHNICISEPGNFNDKVLRCHQVFLELIKPLQNISLECIRIQFLHSLVISARMWWIVIWKKCTQCKLILYYQE